MATLLHFNSGRFLNLTLTLIASFFLVTTGWGQTVTSDKDDYAPGEVAIISGSGWTGDNYVDVHFEETPAYHAEHQHDFHGIAVDVNGNWEIRYQIEERHLGVAFDVHVVGKQSGHKAHTYFTDGQLHDFTIGGQSVVPLSGTATQVNYPASIRIVANKGSASIKLVASNLPDGVTFSPSSIDISENDTKTFSITLQTDINSPVILSPGHEFTITASTPHSNGESIINQSGRLIINGSACTPPSVTEQPSSASLTYGSNAIFTVRSNGPSDRTYQWQVKTTPTGSFMNISGSNYSMDASTGALTITKPSVDMSTFEYRVIVSGCSPVQTATSTAALLTVNKKAASVVVADKTKEYGSADPALTGTLSGFLAADGITASYSTTATQTSNVGEYAITATLADPNSKLSNYSVTNTAGKLTIIQAPATITVADLAKTYNGSAQGATVTTSPVGLDVNVTYDGAANVPTAAGSYAVVAALDNSNYSATNGTGSLVIAQKALTVTANDKTRQYNVANPAFDGVLTGVVSGDGITASYSTTATQDSNVGEYVITTTLADPNSKLSNYSVTNTAGKLTIIQAPATITVAGLDKTYNGSAQGATVTTSPVGLDVNVTYDGAATVPTAAGTYAVVAALNNGNYSATNGTGSLVIAKASTTTIVTLAEGPFTYTGEAITPATVSVKGAGGLDITPAASYSSNTNAGTATASFNYSETANYLASSDSKTFEIGKAATTTVVTLAEGPFTYTGEAIIPATVRVTGAGGLYITPDASYSNNTNAGKATASFSYSESANHLASSDSKNFTIGKAATETVVTIAEGPFTYTGSAITPATVRVTGAGGLNITPDASYSNNTNAGTATASFSYSESANHLASSDSKNFTIGKAATTTVVTLAEGPFTYTGSAITPATVRVTGAGGLNITPDASYSNNTNAGTAIASFSYSESANYLASSDSKNFEIGKAITTTVVTLAEGPFTYTGSAITPATVRVTGAGGLNITPDASYSNNTNAGTATASFSYSESANHLASSDSKNFTIGKAATETVVTIAEGPFTYTGSAITPATVRVTGAGGVVLSTPAADYSDNINAGTATASYRYAGDANHLGSSDSETFAIGKANATIVVTGKTVTYNGAAHRASGTVVGVIGEALAGLNLGTSFTNVPGGTASWTFTDATGNYNNQSGSVGIVINKADAVVSVEGKTVTYNGQAHGASGLAKGVNDETLAGLDLGANFTNVPGGTANWTFTDATGNYKDQSGSVGIVINKAEQTTTWTAPSNITYGTKLGAIQLNATVAGVEGGSAAGALSYNPVTGTLLAAGTHDLTVTAAATVNYNVASKTVKITVNPAVLTITANNATKHEGQVNLTFSVSYSEFVNGEDNGALIGTLAFNTLATVNSCAGDYDINPSGLTSGNYAITFVKGTLTVRGLSIDASESSTPVAQGLNATLKATVTPAVSGVAVSFYLDSDYKGTSLTNTSGTASLVVSGLAVKVYKVTAVIGNQDSKKCSESTAYLPVYDPNGGFVTGGGWIDSPAGALVADLTATGKANFGFVSKYKRGSNQVDGSTEFQFKAGNLNFKSQIHNDGSLVIAGAKAIYKGVGTVNGTGNYGFMVSAIDGQVTGGGGTDKFRIKIWDKNKGDALVYDNQKESLENADATTVIGGGSIVIHEVKSTNKIAEVNTKPTIAVSETPVVEILESMAIAPNPVQTDAKVRFSLLEDAAVVLSVYDFNGREVVRLFSGAAKANQVNEVEFLRRNLPSGVYIVKLTTDRGNSYNRQVILE